MSEEVSQMQRLRAQKDSQIFLARTQNADKKFDRAISLDNAHALPSYLFGKSSLSQSNLPYL